MIAQTKWRPSILLLLVLALSACMPNAIKEQQSFNQKHLMNNKRIEHINVANSQQGVHAAVVVGSNPKARQRAVVFVHGTPGDWQNAGRYLLNEDLNQIATVVSLDRPGWGASTVAESRNQVAFSEQAEGIALVLRSLREEMGVNHLILAGHSLGASISPQVAMDFPDLVDGLLLMAGSLSPEFGGPRWYNRLAVLPGVYHILPAALVNSNKEIMALKENLLAMKPGWQQLHLPVVVIQGMKDKLVYPQNIEFAEQQLHFSRQFTAIRLQEAGHLVNLEHQDLVIRTLKDMLELPN